MIEPLELVARIVALTTELPTTVAKVVSLVTASTDGQNSDSNYSTFGTCRRNGVFNDQNCQHELSVAPATKPSIDRWNSSFDD